MPLEYRRDIPVDSTQKVIDVTKQHIRDHLAAVASPDDDPRERAQDVRIWVSRHPDNSKLLRIEGYLDAEPDAPYLREGYDPMAFIDDDLLKSAGLIDG